MDTAVQFVSLTTDAVLAPAHTALYVHSVITDKTPEALYCTQPYIECTLISVLLPGLAMFWFCFVLCLQSQHLLQVPPIATATQAASSCKHACKHVNTTKRTSSTIRNLAFRTVCTVLCVKSCTVHTCLCEKGLLFC
jgi:hypothetical protein